MWLMGIVVRRYIGVLIVLIKSVDSISRDERDSP